MKPLPSVEYLRERFDLDPETGVLTWRARVGSDAETKRWNRRHAGKAAGATHLDGHREVKIDGRAYRAHRIIWALEHGVI
jgi:hypothetical protein